MTEQDAAHAGPRHDGQRRAILALDTATARVVLAVGTPRGEPLGGTWFAAEHQHGARLLPAISRLLGEANIRRSRLVGIVVGTGPGAFTGLRVGLATAKGLAHGLSIPVVGISTGDALLAAADRVLGSGPWALLLPAGPADRVLCRSGAPPRLVPGGADPELRAGEQAIAVDLGPGRADAAAIDRGDAIRDQLAAELLRLGADRLRDRRAGDDAARLVPEYVTLPRGVTEAAPETAVQVTGGGR